MPDAVDDADAIDPDDDLIQDRAMPAAVGPKQSRAQRARLQRKQYRRRRLVALAVLAVVGVALFFGGSKLWQRIAKPSDYAGAGITDIVFEVHPGDTTAVIGQGLVDANIVADAGIFLTAAQGNEAIAAIQPGYYKMRTEVSAANAVTALADPNSRVGLVTIPEGSQLDDIEAVKNGAITEGVFSMISEATCVELNGQKKCVPVADLKSAAKDSSLTDLKVPDWATEGVKQLGPDHRRIEGLIAPGTWNVNPSSSATEILADLITTGTEHYTEHGLLDTAKARQMSPYEILTVGSLVQKEALPPDFEKVARVIYNRLAEPQRLEFDSTVNYPLDRQEVATTDRDRHTITPWNTYASDGLPATPIGSPGDPALEAAEHPAEGDWLYFVTIDQQGTTLFTHDFQQHLANIEQAQQSGILDSGR